MSGQRHFGSCTASKKKRCRPPSGRISMDSISSRGKSNRTSCSTGSCSRFPLVVVWVLKANKFAAAPCFSEFLRYREVVIDLARESSHQWIRRWPCQDLVLCSRRTWSCRF